MPVGRPWTGGVRGEGSKLVDGSGGEGNRLSYNGDLLGNRLSYNGIAYIDLHAARRAKLYRVVRMAIFAYIMHARAKC